MKDALNLLLCYILLFPPPLPLFTNFECIHYTSKCNTFGIARDYAAGRLNELETLQATVNEFGIVEMVR
ncbi:MAG: hypothetical protein HWN65_19280 [Candidatus Helarchaeota archaeon]|nr:hypothetical protein [Candidatus Helarchaeota archaeon]